jgi:hypothetical protein
VSAGSLSLRSHIGLLLNLAATIAPATRICIPTSPVMQRSRILRPRPKSASLIAATNQIGSLAAV